DRKTGRLAALLYAVTLLPFVAANVLTPDTLLTFWAVCCAYFYMPASGLVPSGRRGACWVAFGICAGMGVLTKGPAILIFLAPLAVEFLLRERWRAFTTAGPYVAGLVAAGVGALWYVPIIMKMNGAGAYFLDNEIIGRLFTSSYHRNPEAVGGLVVYLPVLLLGTLPSSVLWPALARRLYKKSRPRRVTGRPRGTLIALWIGIPLVILLAARSRLPLYALPLFVPIALLTARAARVALPARGAERRRLLLVGVGVWISCLVIVKASSDRLYPERNTATLAHELRPLVPDDTVEVVVVDRKMNALPLYGFKNVERVTVNRDPYPFYMPTETLAEEMAGQRHETGPFAYIVPQRKLAKFSKIAASSGMSCQTQGSVHDSVVLVCAPEGRTAGASP
ncbi:MAG TPA: glycosyltransferase family 39 protein, partial [Candidatus Polarisedimenticolia bacterium]|nr:glycosyltransferase family 39 protein [Candidatus Polarisedimenticolia bacterium]